MDSSSNSQGLLPNNFTGNPNAARTEAGALRAANSPNITDIETGALRAAKEKSVIDHLELEDADAPRMWWLLL